MNKGFWSFILMTMLMLFSNTSWATPACQVDYNISNDWGSGFGANVTITNTGDPVSSWQATWTMPGNQQITGLWSASYSQSGSAVQVNNASWNGSLATGASTQFGFNAAYSGANDKPSDIRINGILCEGQEPPPPPVVACDVTYQITYQWGTGFTADVLISNTGDPINGWTAAWDMPNSQQITGLWNGNYTQSGDHVEVTNVDWNKVVASGSNIQFGFNAAYSGTNNIPGNITLNGVKCGGQVDPPEPPPPEPVACEVDYHVRNQWDTGFTTDVNITNTGTALDGWEVTWSMPTGQQVYNLWNGNYTQQNDNVSVTSLDWNKTVAKNGVFTFGFNATHTGFNPAPIDLAVNGVRCSGQDDEILLPPSSPSNLQSSMVDNTYVALSWADNSDNEESFELQRRLQNGSWATLVTLPADTISYEDKTMEIGNAYEYQLRAANKTGNSAFTTIVSAKRQDRTDIRAPMLANSCATCHSTNGVSAGPSIPSISGLDRDYFIRTMQAYQTGERASSIMDRVAKGYTDTQIERMADYFSSMTFVAAEQTTDQALVDKGRGIHESRCIFCHSGTGEDDSLTGTRLDGQWATYLHATLEDYAAGRSSNIPEGMAGQMSGLKDLFGDDALQALAEYYAASATAKAGGDNGNGDGSTDGSGDTGTDGSGGDSSTGGDSGSGDSTVPPATPTGAVTGIVDNAVINLNWTDTSNNEQGFRIERRISGASEWEAVTTTTANTHSYTDNTAVMGNTYEYRITAFNAAGDSTSVTTTATLLTLLKYGEQQYQQQSCASCHGNDGSGGFTNRPLTGFTADRLSELTEINRTSMPPSNPAACEGNCALGIAHYIIEVLAANSSGNDGNDTQACVGSPPPGQRSLRLLTRQEFQNTVNDLLHLSVSVIHNMPEENRVEGYDNNVAENLITGARLEAFINQAESLASQGVQQSWSSIVPCTTEDAACAQQFISSFGKRAYRRPLTDDEISSHYLRFTQTSFRDAVGSTVMAMLVSPHFLYRSELGELQEDGTYLLTPYETAAALSYLFLGSMPDDELFRAADSNELATPQQRITQASRLLANTRSREQVGNFVGQWLLSSSPYTLPNKDLTVYPGYTDDVRAAMSQELISFFNHVTFDSSQSFTELFTADYVMANKALADFYSLSGPTGSSLEYTPVTNGTRSGILTLGAVLSRYANSAESHPFKRGAFFYERVLCHDLPAPENAGIVEAPTPDPDATTRERFSFHSESSPSCYSCHQFLDGPGFSFENYDGVGQYRTTENGNLIDASGILRGRETFDPTEELTFTDLQHLSTLVADSDNAAQCVAKQYYRYTTGRVETDADSCALESFIQTYKDNGYNLQTMLLGIVNAPGFTVRRAD